MKAGVLLCAALFVATAQTRANDGFGGIGANGLEFAQNGKVAYQIDYILRTANTWKGPIGKFKLTIDKGSPRNILSLCATDIEKTDYTPPEDLSILIATPEVVPLS